MQSVSDPLSTTFAALADPTRRAILARLAQGDASVKALAEPFALTQPAISKHLRVLRDAKLVYERRVGRERIYELDPRPLQKVAGWIEGYRGFWVVSLDNLKRRLERP